MARYTSSALEHGRPAMASTYVSPHADIVSIFPGLTRPLSCLSCLFLSHNRISYTVPPRRVWRRSKRRSRHPLWRHQHQRQHHPRQPRPQPQPQLSERTEKHLVYLLSSRRLPSVRRKCPHRACGWVGGCARWSRTKGPGIIALD